MPGQIEGTVVAYGAAGNLITDISNNRLGGLPRGEGVTVICDEHETIGIYPADHAEKPSTLLAIQGTSGCLELTIIGESAQAMLGVPLRARVVVKW